MKESKALDSMIAEEKKKLERLEEKQIEISKKIKICKTNIEKYTLMRNNETLNVLSNALDGKGISIDDILLAINAGDMLSLQDKIENVNTKNTNAEQSEA